MMQTTWYLTVQQGPNTGTAYPMFGDAITIGRQPDNQIVIDDSLVSRHHLQLTWQDNAWVVYDLGSANGTWVNGRRISQPTVLSPGDTLKLGQNVVLFLGGQLQDTPPTYIGPDYAAAGGAAGRSSRAWLLLGIAGILTVAVAAVAIVLVLSGDKGSSQSGPITQVVTATATQSSVSTTAIPTDAPTQTPQPTYTPYPTYTPFPTATPTETPTQTPQPTYTLYPTYTPYPTQKPPTAKPPQPTNTPQPTATSQPPYTVAVNKTAFEPWGRPNNPNGCGRPYNDRDPVKRFTVELIVTNQSNQTIPDNWYPAFLTVQGKVPQTCIYDYDAAIQPGETTYVTFVTYVESNDWVQALTLDELDYQVTICFNAAAQVVACR